MISEAITDKKPSIMWLLPLALFGLMDIFALYKALHPHISSLYRSYYIEHSITVDDYIMQMRKDYPVIQRPETP